MQIKTLSNEWKHFSIDQAELVTTPSGLQYEILKEGTGVAPIKGSIVTVHYIEWVEDLSAPDGKGEQIDSSYNRQPFQFQIGVGGVIRGWDEGIATMKVNEVRRLIISPDLAFGTQGFPAWGIPQNATIIFEIERLPDM